jgi:hypothetical protein
MAHEARDLTYKSDWKDIHAFLAAKTYVTDAWNPAYAAFLIKSHMESLQQAKQVAKATWWLVFATWAVAAVTVVAIYLAH